jgi:hypothetical protein
MAANFAGSSYCEDFDRKMETVVDMTPRQRVRNQSKDARLAAVYTKF